MIRLELGFNEKKMIKDGYDPDEAYQKLNELAASNYLQRQSKMVYTSDDDDKGFFGAVSLVVDLIEHNYWFKNYINDFRYEDNETKEELLDEYLSSLETFLLHGIAENKESE